MPVATLTYQLPEEREEHAAALAGAGAIAAIHAVLEHARSRLKYGDLGPEATAEVEALRRLLYDEVRERGLPVE